MITAQRIGYQLSTTNGKPWRSTGAITQEELPGDFTTATEQEVDHAMAKAVVAFESYRHFTADQKATFLRAIANEIEGLGDALVHRVMEESALPEARVRGERGRTTGQLRLFADLLTEGSWVEAVIDTGDPAREPVPKPDLRQMLHPIGPIVVFTASNFPLAYSTAGGDTASALAAGCPVIVKAHEAHPGTNALVAEAVITAAKNTGMPDGVFSTLYARGFEVGTRLVTHPLTQGVGFTGSLAGGRALFDLATNRKSPIPVFAEMSSINPIFLLPESIQTEAESLASQIAASVNLGAGQFCTCPGLIIALDDAHTTTFIKSLKHAFASYTPLTMLHAGIHKNFTDGKSKLLDTNGVSTVYHAADNASESATARPAIASVSGADFLATPRLQNEVFGPFTMVIRCADMSEMYQVARFIHGQLTASIYGSKAELSSEKKLIDILHEKAGRVVFNGVPTGVEVCGAMVHGGPYPATTDSRFTAVGPGSIRRWVRPVAYQNCPHDLLPPALRHDNPLGIWRVLDGERGKR